MFYTVTVIELTCVYKNTYANNRMSYLELNKQREMAEK